MSAQDEIVTGVNEREALAKIIERHMLGVAPDDQDAVLEDSDWRLVLSALRRQPSGETREAVIETILIFPETSDLNAQQAEDLADRILALLSARPLALGGQQGVGLAASEIGAHIAKRDAEYEAALADLTIKPDASSLEEFGRSIFGALSDCPAMSIDKQADFVARALWPALSTTPVRAEAQDEQPDITPYTEDLKGLKAAMQTEAQDERAAGEREQTDCKRCAGNGEIVTDWDRYLGAPQPGDQGDEGTTDCPDCDGTGKVDVTEAHPSPTPAADAGLVRIAVEALKPFARLELPKKPVGNAGAYSLLHADIRRAAEAVAALKSTDDGQAEP